MQRLPLALLAVVLFELSGIAVASARPNVTLALAGSVIHKDAKGVEVASALTPSASLHPGETIKYTIVATNAGTDPAIGLTPSARIPNGTSFQPNSAVASLPSHVEYSLDAGKTWAAEPTILVATPNGQARKPAMASAFTMVRFRSERALDPHASASYSYVVRVK